MHSVAEAIELASTHPDVDVLPEEYVRLLGYPRGWVLEGRAIQDVWIRPKRPAPSTM